MSVVAKFHIQSRTKIAMVDSKGNKTFGYRIEGFPVYQGSEENEKFFHFTPSGKLELGTINKEAADQLQPGTDVMITIQPVGQSDGLHSKD